MMKLLITGKNSYVGRSLEKWLRQWPDRYAVDMLSLRGAEWKESAFQPYDVLFHAAGIAHQSHVPGGEYDKVNRDLAIEAAGKAKQEGVRQFILLSSMAVYGFEGRIGAKNEICAETVPRPQSAYGRSKYEAETGVGSLADADFSVCAIRAPMIYGANCPGSYRSLRRLALGSAVVPVYRNERSMIYIDHFCEYTRLLIDGACKGVFCPQDSEYWCTASVMEWIALDNGRRVRKSKMLGRAIAGLAAAVPAVRKAFGNLTYARDLPLIPAGEYCRWNPREAIRATESGWDDGG
ncbi:MAG: NAD-dependent epimerase/dehydratase family protein [Clostridiales bacterium]|nr:NAD-dependent epimerase/dehydratase family protein [Clostridiales bacterium]